MLVATIDRSKSINSAKFGQNILTDLFLPFIEEDGSQFINYNLLLIIYYLLFIDIFNIQRLKMAVNVCVSRKEVRYCRVQYVMMMDGLMDGCMHGWMARCDVVLYCMRPMNEKN